jgi:nucleotide-binding universal stress UspA family protein
MVEVAGPFHKRARRRTMIDTILAPLDGSQLAEHGLDTACKLARETGATLLLLTATPFSVLADSDGRKKERIALQKRQQYLQRRRQLLESQGFTVRGAHR